MLSVVQLKMFGTSSTLIKCSLVLCECTTEDITYRSWLLYPVSKLHNPCCISEGANIALMTVWTRLIPLFTSISTINPLQEITNRTARQMTYPHFNGKRHTINMDIVYKSILGFFNQPMQLYYNHSTNRWTNEKTADFLWNMKKHLMLAYHLKKQIPWQI